MVGGKKTTLKHEKGSFPYYTLARRLVELMPTITWGAKHALNELLATEKRLKVVFACIGC